MASDLRELQCNEDEKKQRDGSNIVRQYECGDSRGTEKEALLCMGENWVLEGNRQVHQWRSKGWKASRTWSAERQVEICLPQLVLENDLPKMVT